MKELIVVNDKFNMVVDPTKLFENDSNMEVTSSSYFHFPRPRYLSANNPAAGC